MFSIQLTTEIKAFWQRYCQEENLDWQKTSYQAWAFGDSPVMAEELLALVLSGQKTGTSSAYQAYEDGDEPLPQVTDLRIILNGQGQPVCLIQTTSVEILPFNQVSEIQAFKEGEGDRTLSYWQTVHQKFWEREFQGSTLTFKPEMLIVYEEFKVIFQ